MRTFLLPVDRRLTLPVSALRMSFRNHQSQQA